MGDNSYYYWIPRSFEVHAKYSKDNQRYGIPKVSAGILVRILSTSVTPRIVSLNPFVIVTATWCYLAVKVLSIGCRFNACVGVVRTFVNKFGHTSSTTAIDDVICLH